MKQEDVNITLKSTKSIQEESMILYMQALGYQPIHDPLHRLRYFRAEQYDRHGVGKISITTAIKMHNTDAEEVFNFIKYSPDDFMFADLLNLPGYAGQSMINILTAGSCKLVKRVKAVGSRKNGFVVQADLVEFANRYVYSTFANYIEAE